MNLVILGGKNVENVSAQLHNTYDDIEIFSYKDTNTFLGVIANRGIDVHRLLSTNLWFSFKGAFTDKSNERSNL